MKFDFFKVVTHFSYIPLVGRNLRGLYENGVFNGVIKYFNKVLHEYNVVFEDDSEDYLDEEDINGVDVILH